jgi:hypothetical protein
MGVDGSERATGGSLTGGKSLCTRVGSPPMVREPLVIEPEGEMV